ncbi:MAG: hypothetical protein HYS25_01035 [Ignavibacteriales bacterium]|nr:hypothetical protein [Ignavibacteriales bacterium]
MSDHIIPKSGKFYLLKIISEKLDNGKPDKLYNTGNYIAKFDGRYFLLGSLKRRRARHHVKIICEAQINRDGL